MAIDYRPRFDSVDALRGLAVAAMLLVNNPGDWGQVYAPLRHAQWNGCTPADLVFPFFLFVVGVSIALARSRLANGAVLLRAARIIGLGLVLHAIAYLLLDRPEYRIPGVLQRIGLCYGAVALLAIHTRPLTHWLLFGAILSGYWAFLSGGDPITPAHNFDPEGLLGTPAAVATTILGLRAGEWLKRGGLRRLVVAGIAALLAGELWAQVLPLNKTLWTPSYVLWTGGWAMIALAALDRAVDLERWPALGRRPGVNAIAIYAGAWILSVVLDAARWKQPLFENGFGWIGPPELASLAYALAFTALWWAVAVALDRRGIRIRI
jgi:predicted acyltransferase